MIKIISVEQAADECPELFADRRIGDRSVYDRRRVLATIGTGLLAAAGPVAFSPPPANAQLLKLLLRAISVAQTIWDVGSTIYGLVYGVNRASTVAQSPIIIQLHVNGVLGGEAVAPVDAAHDEQFQIAYQVPDGVRRQGGGFVLARAQNSVKSPPIQFV